MNTLKSWIKEYVPDLDIDDAEYMSAMTMSGTKVESYKRLDNNLENILIGKINKIDRHPNANKLIICQVDVGYDEVQIVTGANNVNVGDKVPVVLDGGRVAGGHDGGPMPKDGISIKAGQLRGIDSNGMLCAIQELGAIEGMFPDAPEDGIYILDEDAPIGDDAISYMGLRDSIYEYEITSNRVDCFGILGIAREVAATFRIDYIPPTVDIENEHDNIEDYVTVEIDDTKLCPAYYARVCTDVKIGPSPDWMVKRLAASGIRPINNLVDITNYVMEEMGQPMHAFDLEHIDGNKIVVRRAKDGESFVTLDGIERKLDSDILMICDANKEIAIAGIMGGENSMITDNVKTVMFESATFNGANIRRSAKRLGLRTDASSKFEKGLDVNTARIAVDRACQLMELIGCGKVVRGIAGATNVISKGHDIGFDLDKVNALLGTDIDFDVMSDILLRVGIEVDAPKCNIHVPYYRSDVEGIADIAEEVARFYGYDKIPTTLPKTTATTGRITFKNKLEKQAGIIARMHGFSQGMCYSFESPKVFDKLLINPCDSVRDAIIISNPLGEDYSCMRSVSINGILTSLATNYNRRNKNVRLYELGNIYKAYSLPLDRLPDERMHFTLGMYGDGDFYTMKGVVESYLETVGIDKGIEYSSTNEYTYLHPGRSAKIVVNKDIIGVIGELHPLVAKNYDMDTRVIIGILDIHSILEMASFDKKYQGIARFPAVNRDISMIVPKNILSGDIVKIIKQRGGKLIEECKLFDVYEGEQVEEGYKSMAYSISFRAIDRTLEDKEVTATMKKILNGLSGIGIELRQ